MSYINHTIFDVYLSTNIYFYSINKLNIKLQKRKLSININDIQNNNLFPLFLYNKDNFVRSFKINKNHKLFKKT